MLVTTRDERLAKRLAGIDVSIVVSPMSSLEAQELLERRRALGSSDRCHCKELFEALEYIPLAIAQAAAFIDENHITLSQYLEIFWSSDSELQDLLSEDLGDLRRDSQSHNSIIKTWKISFDLISKQKPRAAEILSLMAVLDRQGIPESLLRDASDRNIDFRTALGTLLAFSLIKAGTGGAGYGLHRLVQLATQRWLEMQDTIGKWQEKALTVVAGIFPSGEVDNWTICESLLPHAQKVLQYGDARKICLYEYSQLLCNVARLDLEQGHFENACAMYLAAIEVQSISFGSDHPSTLLTMAGLGRTYARLGRLKAAEELQVQAVKDMKRVLGSEHVSTFDCLKNLAMTYIDQSRWDEAEKLQVEVVADIKRVRGSEDRHTLPNIDNLAYIYGRQGRLEEAEKLHVQVLDARKRLLGAGHQETLASMNNLELTYYRQGRLEEAEALFVQVVEMSRIRPGAEHPSTLIAMGNLALLYQYQRRWSEAETLSMQVLESQKKVLSSEHPDTLKTMSNLAVTWSEQDRYNEAIAMMESVLESRRKILGANHEGTLAAAAWLEDWLDISNTTTPSK